MRETTHRGTWTPDDRAASIYRELPFEVPAGCSALEVELEYDAGGGGVLDLGCAGPAGFRGWSGGARRRFAIRADAATPGYRSGEPELGTWHVWLALHRVPADGLAWQVRVRTTDATAGFDVEAEPAPERPLPTTRPPRRELPTAHDGQVWLAGDLHAHTVHSDGALGLDGLAVEAVEAGLDFLAVTDHNTTSHHPLLPDASTNSGVALLPGQEVTTDRGHANAFGEIGWIDFRAHPDDWLVDVEHRGGLLSINHPLAADCAWLWPLHRRPGYAELWHWSWLDRAWGGPLAWWLAWDLATVPLGGSDFHTPGDGHPVGSPVTWVCCDGSATEALAGDAAYAVPEVLQGLRAGRTAISADRFGPILLREGEDLVALDAEGLMLCDPSGRRRPVAGPRTRLRQVDAGPHWLADERNAVHALCGGQ